MTSSTSLLSNFPLFVKEQFLKKKKSKRSCFLKISFFFQIEFLTEKDSFFSGKNADFPKLACQK
ncbi:MAG: hypothetical protein B7X84_08490 [Alphaproteobacteria bacterium 17-39-52]|nr:MAG: hypothetical protein B7X84_08490 [Alphaproteobacteria bacterium 17-39-52]